MSYTDFSESDILIQMSRDYLECVACPINGQSFRAYSTDIMVIHLDAHESLGDQYPNDLIDKLWSDDEKNFPYDPE